MASMPGAMIKKHGKDFNLHKHHSLLEDLKVKTLMKIKELYAEKEWTFSKSLLDAL